MKYINYILMYILLCTPIGSLRSDEILYWMTDNQTIVDYETKQNLYKISESSKHGTPITSARIVAVETVNANKFFNDKIYNREIDVDYVYLDLYYQKNNLVWVVDYELNNTSCQLYNGETKTGIFNYSSRVRGSVGSITETFGKTVDYTAYSFAVELGYWDGDDTSELNWKFAAISDTKTYRELTSYIQHQAYIPLGTWSPGQFYTVPEPNGSLLIAVGLVAFLLKRQKCI